MALREQEAWDIATTWLAPLCGNVRLVVDDRDGAADSIVESYAWVRIEPPTPSPGFEHADERSSVMRAAMLTWTALSKCVGFGGRENPTFWKRVFSEHYSGHSVRVQERVAPCVSDAVAFFDRPDIPFPRFMVPVNDLYYREPRQVDTRHVFGLAGHGDLTPRVAFALARILDKLQPFMGVSVPSQSVEICVTVNTFLMSASSPSPYERLAKFVEDVNSNHPSDPYQPQFRVVQFQEDVADNMGNSIHQESFSHFARTTPIQIGHFGLHQPMLDLTVHDRATWVSSLCRLDGVQAGVTSLSFSRHAIDDDLFDALFSALPFARSVRSVAFDTLSLSRKGSFDKRDLPWIAYALFHPRADTSSCCQLELQQAVLTDQTVSALGVMARGNNLLALLNGTPPVSDAYYTADLRQGTTVRTEPISASDTMYHVSDTIRVDVCDVSSPDTTSWGEWVAVIRPAYGLGWVRASQVHNVHALRSSTPCLTSLTLRNGRSHRGSANALMSVLSVLGAQLKRLDLGAFGHLESTSIEGVLRACPSLNALVVCHSGAFWSDAATCAASGSRLEELELVIPDDTPHLCEQAGAILGQLHALRVTTSRDDLFKASQPAIERILNQWTSLRFFHWRNPSRSVKQFDPYESSRERVQEQLTRLQLPGLASQHAQEPFSSSSAIAFLSVVEAGLLDNDKTKLASSALARLTDPDVLSTIFQFATSPRLRMICIESHEELPVTLAETTWLKWIHDGLKALFVVSEVTT